MSPAMAAHLTCSLYLLPVVAYVIDQGASQPRLSVCRQVCITASARPPPPQPLGGHLCQPVPRCTSTLGHSPPSMVLHDTHAHCMHRGTCAQCGMRMYAHAQARRQALPEGQESCNHPVWQLAHVVQPKYVRRYRLLVRLRTERECQPRQPVPLLLACCLRTSSHTSTSLL